MFQVIPYVEPDFFSFFYHNLLCHYSLHMDTCWLLPYLIWEEAQLSAQRATCRMQVISEKPLKRREDALSDWYAIKTDLRERLGSWEAD